MRRLTWLLPIFLLLPFGAIRAQDAGSAASQIEKLLKIADLRTMVEGYFNAKQVWESSKSVILDDFDASLRTGMAFATFGSHERVNQYKDLAKDCAEASAACAEAVEKDLLETDLESRLKVGRLLLLAAECCALAGQGDKADPLEERAKEHLEAVAAGESPPPEVFGDLGDLYGRLAARIPPKAEEYFQKATEMYQKAREASGDSPRLCLQVGRTLVRLARARTAASAKDPKDRKLQKSIVEAYEEAMKSFELGLKKNKNDEDLKTSYNEALWVLKGLTKGRAKFDPIMKEVHSRYKKIKFEIPDSELWHVKPVGELEDADDVVDVWKWERERGQALILWIRQYKWDYDYVNEETGDRFGGDNISGLAKRSERVVKEIFKDIKDRKPLGKIFFSKRIPKARGYTVMGMTEKNNRLEFRAIFFKHSKAQRTYQVLVQADLGMLDENPYELEEILSSFELVERK